MNGKNLPKLKYSILMLQISNTRDPSLGECNVEVSLCISLSRGKWFGSDSNDQINYPTSQASPTR